MCDFVKSILLWVVGFLAADLLVMAMRSLRRHHMTERRADRCR